MGKIYKNGILFAGSTENAGSVTFNNEETSLESTNVQGAIEEINNLFSLKEISITGEHVHPAAYAYQSGHMVFANIYFNNLTITANETLQLGTIEISPNKALGFSCIFMNVSNNKVLGYGYLQINTRGNISVLSNFDATQARCTANIAYLC